MPPSEQERWIQALERAGISPRDYDWKDAKDVDAACQRLGVASHSETERRRVKGFLRRCAEPIYRVNASIGNAQSTKGFRAAVYLMAEETQAFSVPTEKPISYGNGNGDDEDDHSTLYVSLLFESKSRAMDFATKIRNWKFNHPLGTSNLDDPIVDRAPTERPGRDDLQPVLLSDYDPNEADDSPCTSLADFRGLSSALPTEPVALVDPLFKYQSIEKDELFSVTRPYKLHLKDKGRFREDENNMLAGSWQFHQLLDGLNTSEGHRIPLLSIGWLATSEHYVLLDDGERRYKVDLQLEFFTPEAETLLRSSLKNGSSRERDQVWKTFVHVRDPQSFKECVQWKREEAERLWREHLDI